MFALAFLILLTTSLVLWYLYMTRHFNYWKNRGIKFVKPLPIFGNILEIFQAKESLGTICRQIHESHPNEKYVGLFVCDEPFLLVRDTELVKHILIKDFSHFDDRTIAVNHDIEPIGSNFLFFLRNPQWHQHRTKLTPIFTSGRLKLMHNLMQECGSDILEYLRKTVPQNPVIETRELTGKYTVDAISSTTFGIQANCFKDENSEFRAAARKLFSYDTFYKGLANACYFCAPNMVKLFRMKFFDAPSIAFLRGAFLSAMEKRKRNGEVRNDLIDIILKMKASGQFEEEEKEFGEDTFVSKAIQFFAAGFETSAATISFTLFELAKNQDVQDRLREEILQSKEENNGFTYDSLANMEYLHMCIKETLRKYPILPFLDRKCTKDYTIPGTDIKLDTNSSIYISVWALQMDEEYFPNPMQYQPERFTKENEAAIPSTAYMPFGLGPRNCVGMRFGVISASSCLAHILSEFKVVKSTETPDEVDFNPKGFILQPNDGLKVKFVKL